MPTPPIILRSAVTADIAAIQRVGVDADVRFVAIGRPELGADTSIPTATAEAAIQRDGLLVAVDGVDVVGWAYVGRIDGELCLGQISVLRSRGREGIGTRLLLQIIERARAAGEPSIVLNTETDVPWNGPWYERHGFRPIPRASWSPALERVAHDQGLDWTKRTHLRLALTR